MHLTQYKHTYTYIHTHAHALKHTHKLLTILKAVAVAKHSTKILQKVAYNQRMCTYARAYM